MGWSRGTPLPGSRAKGQVFDWPKAGPKFFPAFSADFGWVGGWLIGVVGGWAFEKTGRWVWAREKYPGGHDVNICSGPLFSTQGPKKGPQTHIHTNQNFFSHDQHPSTPGLSVGCLAASGGPAFRTLFWFSFFLEPLMIFFISAKSPKFLCFWMAASYRRCSLIQFKLASDPPLCPKVARIQRLQGYAHPTYANSVCQTAGIPPRFSRECPLCVSCYSTWFSGVPGFRMGLNIIIA